MPKNATAKTCPLCSSNSKIFWESGNALGAFYACNHCTSIFKDRNNLLQTEEEKSRYLNHDNNVEDKAYQNFVSPITQAVLSDFNNTETGLDFGCGSGPVISHLLKKEGYSMALYDPFFHPKKAVLEIKYNFIVCCEVMEHFYNPFEEFQHLKNLLLPKGKLYCKTNLISNTITAEHFSKWYYKNDPTHVFFYSPNTLNYIKETFDFKDLTYSTKLITFSL